MEPAPRTWSAPCAMDAAAVSGTALGPNCSSRRRASSLVRPVGIGTFLAAAITQIPINPTYRNRLPGCRSSPDPVASMIGIPRILPDGRYCRVMSFLSFLIWGVRPVPRGPANCALVEPADLASSPAPKCRWRSSENRWEGSSSTHRAPASIAATLLPPGRRA